MSNVTALEAKTRFGELLARVALGEEIVITRHEKPVARIVPEGGRNIEEVRAAVVGLRNLQQEIAVRTRGEAGLTDDEVREAIEEGRL